MLPITCGKASIATIRPHDQHMIEVEGHVPSSNSRDCPASDGRASRRPRRSMAVV